MTPLSVAANCRGLSVVSYLLQQGVDVNKTMKGGLPPLAYAFHGLHKPDGWIGCQRTQIKIILKLLKHGADPNYQVPPEVVNNEVYWSRAWWNKKTWERGLFGNDPSGNPPLTSISYVCHFIENGTLDQRDGAKLLKALLKHGLDVNALNTPGPNGFPPIGLMIRKFSPQWLYSLQILLDAGADPNARSRDGGSELGFAVGHGEWKVGEWHFYRTLEGSGAGWGGQRLILQIINLLLDHGADPNYGDGEGQPPIIVAIQDAESLEPNTDSTLIIDTLIRAGADINPRVKVGTPLMCAIRQGFVHLEKDLARADLQLLNSLYEERVLEAHTWAGLDTDKAITMSDINDASWNNSFIPQLLGAGACVCRADLRELHEELFFNIHFDLTPDSFEWPYYTPSAKICTETNVEVDRWTDTEESDREDDWEVEEQEDSDADEGNVTEATEDPGLLFLLGLADFELDPREPRLRREAYVPY